MDAADLPKTYKIAIASNQANALDGGESYKSYNAADTAMGHLEYTHNGLSLTAGDAGELEVRYTTQTLKVYVHNERDQVRGLHRQRSGRGRADVGCA